MMSELAKRDCDVETVKRALKSLIEDSVIWGPSQSSTNVESDIKNFKLKP